MADEYSSKGYTDKACTEWSAKVEENQLEVSLKSCKCKCKSYFTDQNTIIGNYQIAMI